jgi:predicted porin
VYNFATILKRYAVCASLNLVGCACVTSAYAQSSVTLYGSLDVGLLYTNRSMSATGKNTGKQFSLVDAPDSYSHFGIAGTEDIGGGIKVKFKIESGVDTVNGGLNNCNGNLFGCQAWIAMDGSFGEVKAGLQLSPFFWALYDSDPRGFAQFGSGLINKVDNIKGTSAFDSNSINYKSPKFYGFEGSAMLALGNTAGNFQAGRQYSASLKYDNGGIMVDAAIFEGNSSIPASGFAVPFEGRTAGAGYNIGGLTLKGSFTNYKVSGSFNDNVYGAGMSYFISPKFSFNQGIWITSDRNHTANHSILGGLGAYYYLSKQTTLYAQLAVANNHGLMDTGLVLNGNGTVFGLPGTTTGAVLGITHSF